MANKKYLVGNTEIVMVRPMLNSGLDNLFRFSLEYYSTLKVRLYNLQVNYLIFSQEGADSMMIAHKTV